MMSCQAAHPFGRLNVSIYALYRTIAFWEFSSLPYMVFVAHYLCLFCVLAIVADDILSTIGHRHWCFYSTQSPIILIYVRLVFAYYNFVDFC